MNAGRPPSLLILDESSKAHGRENSASDTKSPNGSSNDAYDHPLHMPQPSSAYSSDPPLRNAIKDDLSFLIQSCSLLLPMQTMRSSDPGVGIMAR